MSDLQSELEQSHAEGRGNAAEIYKIRGQMDEYNDTIEALRRENKNLSGEMLLHEITHYTLWRFS